MKTTPKHPCPGCHREARECHLMPCLYFEGLRHNIAAVREWFRACGYRVGGTGTQIVLSE